ncbi:MAG: hypothetical protein M5U15_03590 [Kiritimatiellae bacterium]|nr:hypothetical protein [Kiritimatiellia bacterium]
MAGHPDSFSVHKDAALVQHSFGLFAGYAEAHNEELFKACASFNLAYSEDSWC